MVNRFAYSIMRTVLSLSIITLVGWSCISVSARGMPQVQDGRTSTVPEILAADRDPDALQVVWSFDTGDLLACESPALALRHLQRRFGAKVQLTMIAVGEDPHLIGPFVRRERLDANVVRLTPEEYQRQFGAATLPRLQFARAGHREQALTGETWSDGTDVRDRGIEQTARLLLGDGALAVQ